MDHRALERLEERGRGFRRHRADDAAGHQEPESVDRIARVGNEDHVAGRDDRLGDIGEAFLGAERRHDLPLRVELHPEPAAVVCGLSATQAGDTAGSGIAIRARLADRLLELVHDMERRRQIGIAHPQIDDVGPGIPRRGFGAVDLLEYVGRQAPDPEELLHAFVTPRLRRRIGGRGPAGLVRFTRARRLLQSDDLPEVRPSAEGFFAGCFEDFCPGCFNEPLLAVCS
jgi:hypothetical protein